MGKNTSTVYAMYLRKSRADTEAEQRGEGETLARHRVALLELVAARSYAIGQQYREIVLRAGQSIEARRSGSTEQHDLFS